jgi:hypothetical protein
MERRRRERRVRRGRTEAFFKTIFAILPQWNELICSISRIEELDADGCETDTAPPGYDDPNNGTTPITIPPLYRSEYECSPVDSLGIFLPV